MKAITPESLRSRSIYQIFPRNYSEEGTLQAAAKRLDEVAALGFDYVYLTPVHPIGVLRRKGSLGSPYAIADYRAVDPLLGGEAGLHVFIDEAHKLGLGVIMDVVYNHTSPDSVLAAEHPEWFWKGKDGKPGPRIADWSDVADLDYSKKELWDYQIETLVKWARFGADGFRCDVASLVPVDFWVEAKRRVAAEVKPVLWLAESVHKEFVTDCRRRGFYAASDPELHRAFDLTYDYDGRQELDEAWRGEKSLGYYLRHLEVQEALYPADAVKLRCLENHDQGRAAARFGRAERLRNWTLFAMLLPGAFMAYMGEELAMERRIGLFDKETMKAAEGDPSFTPFFKGALELSTTIKREAPFFDAKLLAEGLVLVERHGKAARYSAVLNLDGRTGWAKLPAGSGLEGAAILGAKHAMGSDGLSFELGLEPLVLKKSPK
jgi:Glycosidases